MQDVLPIALHVVGGCETRDNRVGIDSNQSAGRLAPDTLVPEPEISRPVAVNHHVVLRKDGVVVDVQLGALDRQPVLDQRFARHEHRQQIALRIEDRVAGRIGGVIGVEHITGRRL